MLVHAKYIKKLYIVIILIVPHVLLSQNYIKLYDLGNEEFAKGHYFNAAKLFTEAHKQEPEITQISFKQAEALYKINCYDEAYHIFNEIAKDFPQNYPLSLYYEAEIDLFFGKYSDALTSFATFSNLYPNNDVFRLSAGKDRLVCDYALKHKDTENVVLNRLPAKSFNSEVNQYSLVEIDDSVLIYTIPQFTKDSASFTAKLHANKHIFKYETLLNIINALPADISSITFSSDKNMAFFSACTFTNATTQCSIYQTKYDSMEWSKPQLLPASINEPNSSNAQPCFANIMGKQMLFFTSSRAGGNGKYDIWCAEFPLKQFSKAVNLGDAVNSEYDEITPFYDNTTNRLYFSSQMPHGFGGYDIFYSQLAADTTWKPSVNMGQPINSSSNDVYYSVSENNRRAYLTSNRTANIIDDAAYYFNSYFGYAVTEPEIEKTQKEDSVIIQHTAVVAQSKPVETAHNDTAESVIKQLSTMYPLKIYFDHNQPFAGVTNYDSLLTQYLSQKPNYLKNVRDNKETSVQDFFINDVVGHFTTLQQSLLLMQDVMKQGKHIVISLRGCTSSAGGDSYNTVLAQNRVKLITHIILSYKNGVLASYVNKQLTIQTLPPVLSSQIKKVQSAISLQSAAQRYVEIMVQVSE